MRRILTASAERPTLYNLFGSMTPQYLDNSYASPFTYGTRWFSDVAGSVVAVRFYKGGTASGSSHTVAVYNSSGALLGSKATSGEPSSGWHTTNLDIPITITANMAYTAAVFFPLGHGAYSDTFFSNPFNAPPLHAYANSNGGNGVYSLNTALSFPTSSYNEGYFIDPVLSV